MQALVEAPGATAPDLVCCAPTMHRHPQIRAWVREEDGSYKAELHGANLHVSWRPEPRPPATEPRGYAWAVEVDGKKRAESSEVAEEIEHAMLAAEDAAAELERQAAVEASRPH